MSNEELYNKMEEQYCTEDMITFSVMISEYYSILFEEDVRKGNLPSENKYDMNWWIQKSKDLLDEHRRTIEEKQESNKSAE